MPVIEFRNNRSSNPLYLTTPKAAKMKGIDKNTFRSHVDEGKGPEYIERDGIKLFHRDNVDAWNVPERKQPESKLKYIPETYDPIVTDMFSRGVSPTIMKIQMLDMGCGVTVHDIKTAIKRLGLVAPKLPKPEKPPELEIVHPVEEFKVTGDWVRDGASAYEYSKRVLRLAGKDPVVSILPMEAIHRANLILKERGYPQISDRSDWVV